jgi:hypothetical protein
MQKSFHRELFSSVLDDLDADRPAHVSRKSAPGASC